MRGSWGPLSGSEVRNGRVTIIVLQLISLEGIASSKSNARTNENISAFILHISAMSVFIASSGPLGLIVTRNLLDDGKAVANTRVGARDEREQVAEDTGDRSNGIRNGFPAFWSATTMSLDAGAAHAQVDGAYLNLSASSPHIDFILCTVRIGMTTKSPFVNLRFCVPPYELNICDSRIILRT